MIRLAVRIAREQSELVLAELLELAPSGVEEVEIDERLVEYAVYGAPGELPALPELEAVAGGALVEISTSEIADDWPQRWREFHKPLVLDDRLCVRPPWAPCGPAAIDVVIDPGLAFGTGAHPTTRLCLELMLDHPQQRDDLGAAHLGEAAGRRGGRPFERAGMASGRPGRGRAGGKQRDDLGAAPLGEAGGRAGGKPRGSFVDLGCGSGVLAIVAAKLGFSPVIGLDLDPAAVSVTNANAELNGVEVQARRFDMRREQVPDCDFLAANVLAGPLAAWAASQRRLPPALILSGVLCEEADAIAAAFRVRGLRERQRRTRADWSALLLAR